MPGTSLACEWVRVLGHPAFVNAQCFLSFGRELERKPVYLEKGFFVYFCLFLLLVEMAFFLPCESSFHVKHLAKL